MAFSPLKIANWFLEQEELDQMKLHKLVYFAHGWRLGLFDKALINEPVEAWTYGPVVRSLYREFKEFGASPITRPAFVWEDGRKVAPRLAVQKKPVTNALLEHVWEKYGQMSGLQLSAITHLPGSPWRVVREQNPRVRSVPIPDDLIRRYFKRLADQDAA